MTANKVRPTGPWPALVALLAAACVEESEPRETDAGSHADASTERDASAGEPDAGDALDDAGANDGDLDAGFDAGPSAPDSGAFDGGSQPEADAGSDAGGDSDAGTCSEACSGDSPICADGVCVECTATETSQCAATEVCDETSGRCVDEYAPFALDCANLPSDGACEGGPVEVLLVVEERGHIAMFDPEDGQFLGYLKRATYEDAINRTRDDEPRRGEYAFATQGPDQCIWTVGEDDRGVERWETSGAFKDNIIPTGAHYAENEFGNDEDIIEDPRSIAFTSDSVYVAATAGYPPRIARFSLTGELDEVVVADENIAAESLLVLRDGSLLLGNSESDAVERLVLDGSAPQTLVCESDEFNPDRCNIWPSQLAYAGGGRVLVAERTNADPVYDLDLETETYSALTPAEPRFNVAGIAPLKSGKWLVTGGDGRVSVLDPASMNPRGQHASVWTDAVLGPNFEMIGRACVPNSVVDAAAVDAPAASCDEPAGPTILAEDFESGDFEDAVSGRRFKGFRERPYAGVTLSLDTAQFAQGSRSLKIEGGAGGSLEQLQSGLEHDLADVRPSYIGYYVRVAQEQGWGGYFSLNGLEDSAYIDTVQVGNGYFTTISANTSTDAPADTWLRVQLRDFDWERRTYDVYLNCERVFDDVPFSAWGTDSLNRIELLNYTPTATAWFDEIVIK